MILAETHYDGLTLLDEYTAVWEIYFIQQYDGVVQRPRKFIEVVCDDDDARKALAAAQNVRATTGDRRGRRELACYIMPDGTSVPDDIEVIAASLDGPLTEDSSQETVIVPVSRMWMAPVPVPA